VIRIWTNHSKQQLPPPLPQQQQPAAAAAAGDEEKEASFETKLLHELEHLLTRQLQLSALLWQRICTPTADAWPWPALLHKALIQAQQLKLRSTSTTGAAKNLIIGWYLPLFKETGKG
jgi:hypothetical protein